MMLIKFLLQITLSLTIVIGSSSEEPFNDASFEKYTKQSLLWAPYRSNCYFGLRPRNVDETPLIAGIMWFDNSRTDGITKFRHFVDQGDRMTKYGWETYDPRLGGKEVIIDDENNLNLTIYFTKSHDGENWAFRVHGEPLDFTRGTTASIILYFNQNGDPRESRLMEASSKANVDFLQFDGVSKELGEYQISIWDNLGELFNDRDLRNMEVAPGCDASKTAHVSLTVPDGSVWKAKDIFQTLMADSVKAILEEKKADVHTSLIPSIFTIRNYYKFPAGNFHYVQKTFDNSDPKGFEFDVVYNKLESQERISTPQQVSGLIASTLDEVTARFNRHFRFKSQNDGHRQFAMETLSNLLGGIGYFHGNQLVDRTTELDEDTFKEVELTHPVEEGPYSLFTSVPSRAAFPRGFYWDEGFHLLQIMDYDFDLAVEICSSWFELIEDSGWVAREVILGNEARSKVPDRFAVQNPNIANPPTLLLAFSEMLGRAIERENQDSLNRFGENTDDSLTAQTNQLELNSDLLINYAKKIYPKLLKHYNWFRESQRSSLDDYLDVLEEEGILNEVHLNETYRWRGRTVTHCLPSGMDDYPRVQPPDESELDVDALAWVGVMTRSMRQIAHILGLEEDEAFYQKIEFNIVENLDTLHWSEDAGCYCDITVGGEWDDERSFACHHGYISLLPFALKLMPPGSPKLDRLVSLMSDPKEIFSDYGLTSLSKSDLFFGEGENYWRGPIWMNINYLVLDALKYYYPEVVAASPKKTTEARSLYQALKENLINTVFHNWENSGYCYEQYSPEDGKGQGIEHFTGWTALVVNIMGRD